ncbi:glycosyltransferase family 2 protein [Roseococcus sp. DSY-14]|uniref:glycosyltransferase family 2 protein n=1 Tax=Roseococcus sp. DSY-14 TaxID=3369650 RepID=UPI00387B494F
MRVSALVVARDEEARLPACLASLGWADEVVVVLDRSSDGSAALARAAGAVVLEGAWPLEGARRNAGIAACAGPWVLEVDADERVPPELAADIRRTIATSPHAFHRVRVDNHVGGRLILHGWGGSFGTTLKPILFRKGAKHWRAQRVHPGLDWTGTEGERLTAHGLHHELDRDVSDMLRRLDRYSSAKAADLLAAGDIGTLPSNLRRLVSRFFKCLIGRKGWKEGGWGVLIALCAGLFPLLSHLKARLEPERHRD